MAGAPSGRQRPHVPPATSLRSRGQGRRRLARGGLPALVPGGRRGRGDGRERPGAGHHGHPALGLRHLGADAGRARPAHQGGGRGERLLPPLHPRVVPAARGRARGGIRSRAGGGDARRRQGARGAARGAADERDGDQQLLRQVGAEPPRPPAALEPVGQRRPLGAAAAALLAYDRVLVAGGAHRPRDRGRRPGLRLAHPRRRVPRHHGRRPRHPRLHRPQDGS